MGAAEKHVCEGRNAGRPGNFRSEQERVQRGAKAIGRPVVAVEVCNATQPIRHFVLAGKFPPVQIKGEAVRM